MKPQPYLTKSGKAIFNEIKSHLSAVECMDVDSYKLSALANAFDLHARASKEMNRSNTAYAQETKTGYSQVSADLTVWQKTLDMINKLSSAFGIDPQSREKIAAFSEKKQELPDIT